LSSELKNDNIKLIHNKTIQGSYGTRRPDWLINLISHVIIVECDENMHNNYDSNDEKERINELHEDLEYRDLVVIRINPDKNGHEKGCFTFENGKIIPNESVWNKRKTLLIEAIRKYIKTIPEKEITEIKIGF